MDEVVFKQVCLHLRNAAPDQWSDFVLMFEMYTQEAVEAVVYANRDMVVEAQGGAKQLRALLEAFKTCTDEPKPASP